MRTLAKRILHGSFLAIATALLGVGIYKVLLAGLALSPRITVATVGTFGFLAAAYAAGSAVQQLRDPTSTTGPDLVEDTLDKANFGEQTATGTVDGNDVLLVANLNRSGFPTLTVHAGGDYETNEDLDNEYVGGTATKQSFENVKTLRRQFTNLVDRYDLSTTDAEEVDA